MSIVESAQHQKLAQLLSTVIFYPSYKEALHKIEDAYAFSRETGLPRNILLIGPSGSGKTTLKDVVEKNNPPVHHEDHIETPILCIDVISPPTIKGMAETVLEKLGDPNCHRGSIANMNARIIHYAKAKKVKLIIFDEMQHIIDHGNKNAAKDVSDWLKRLINQIGASIVLMGLPRTKNILKVNEQLRRRFSQCIELKPFQVNEQAELNLFYSIIRELSLLLTEESELNFNGDLVQRMHFATNGIMDYIVKLLSGAFEHSREHGLGMFDLDNLEETFTKYIWMDGIGTLNPFNSKFCWKPIDFSNY